MILFIGEGGLGNQIFQYAFIKNFAKKGELIVTCNFKKLTQLFDIKENIYNLDNRYIRFILNKFAVPVLEIFSYTRLISSVRVKKIVLKERYHFEVDDVVFHKGLFPIIYIFKGYFQSEKMFNPRNLEGLKIKSIHIKEARKIIDRIDNRSSKVFVHIRRGDYKYESALGKSDLRLPVEYYRKGMDEIEKKLKSITYIILSDDVNFVRKNFSHVERKYISQKSDLVDFAIMTLCDAGVISNSSFSWWGAYFSNRKGTFLSPKFWFGFQSNIEVPIGISPSFAKSIDVY